MRMCAREVITVLHLSDIQFGKNHRFLRRDWPGIDNPYETLLIRLKEDLVDVRQQFGKDVSPDIIVVTGDLTETALPVEFKQANAFLEGLITTLELKSERVVILPGNHDVNREACKAHFAKRAAKGLAPIPPWFPKWDNFRTGLRKYLGHPFTKTEPWSYYEIPDLNVAIAAMNSTIIEGHDIDGPPNSPDIPHHRGAVGEKQLQWFRTQLQERRKDGWLRLGAFHHNWARDWSSDDANLVDGRLVKQLLGGEINALLHGHIHSTSVSWLVQNVPVLATGSAGVVVSERPPETPLQYQILQFRRDTLRQFSRAYFPANQRWAADVSVAKDGLSEFPIPFIDVHGTFGRPVAAEPSPPPSANRAPLLTGTAPEVWPIEFIAEPHAEVRVSIAALLKLELNGRFLLVRNLHHANTFAPFGGVFKAFPTAKTKLDEFGFEPDTSQEKPQDISGDLRGYVSMQNFRKLIDWYDAKRGRELYDECLRRELREEFKQVDAPSDLLDDIPHLTYEYVRTIEEPVALVKTGLYQYRRIEVYQPSMQNPESSTGSENILRRWFDRLIGHNVIAVGMDEIDKLCVPSGEVLAQTVKYLVYDSATLHPDESPFSRYIGLGEAAELFRDFFTKGLSTKLRAEPEAPIQLLHRVEKNYSRSVVGKVQIDGRPCVLKYYPDSGQYAEKEAWALKALGGRVRVPKLLEYRTTPEGPAFLLIEMVNGQRLSSFSRAEQKTLVPLILSEVLRLRDVRHDSYGEIVGQYQPVQNSPDLDMYVRNMVKHWKERLDNLPQNKRTHGDLSFLVRWADRVVNDREHQPLWSELTNGPSLCHSDVKPDDILMVKNGGGQLSSVLLDFDNIFAFVPEFDLCKFHMYLLLGEVNLSLDEYANMIAGIELSVSASAVRRSLVSVYPYVLTRLVNWGIPRKAQDTLEDVARVIRLLKLPDMGN
jgi:3',5'-cyclic AMP phosphodiesterase CpdA